MNKFLYLFLLFFFLNSANAQVADSISYDETKDSILQNYHKGMLPTDSILKHRIVTENNIFPKKFKENLKSRYKEKDFDYTTNKPRESFFAKLQRKISQLLQSIFGESTIGKSMDITWVLIRLFAIALVGFLLYFIIKYLVGKDGNFIFGKRNKKVDITEEQLHENIHEINFPESIASFERAEDYRSAIRYQFLYILKKLSDKKLINWNPEKTNKDYVRELKTDSIQQEFSQLSYIFDYVWYGEFEINETTYQKFKSQYQSFKL